MGSEQILLISGVVGTICRVLYGMGLSGWYASAASLVVSTLVLAIWGYDSGDFARETTWEYFMAWVEMNVVAAGSFHIIEESQKAMART